MTTPEDVIAEETESIAEEIPYYVIDQSRVAELDRSVTALLLSRRCPSCKTRLKSRRRVPSEEAQIKEIAECCATREGFIRADMPMQEIIFRSILSEGNKPVSLEKLHYLVTDQWYSPVNPRSISAGGLKLVLDNDLYYGFAQVPEPAEQG